LAVLVVGVDLAQHPHLSLIFQFLDQSALLWGLFLLFDELVHLRVGDDILSADLAMQG
jgi:hypothetical protein